MTFKRLATMAVVLSLVIGASHTIAAPKKQDTRLAQQVERTITATENGYVMVLTSENPEVVERLHNRAIRPSNRSELTRTKTNIENGIQIEVSSTSQRIIDRLARRVARFQNR